jgi:hypothetical protein
MAYVSARNGREDRQATLLRGGAGGKIREMKHLTLRQLVFALIVFGMLGLLVELVLLEHYEDWQQWIPLGLLAVGLIDTAILFRRTTAGSLRFFRGLMVVFVVTGGLGLYFHLTGNMEFALERDATLTGVRLLLKSVHGGTPILAPGALTQLGLLGLAYAFRHPASRGAAATPDANGE